MREVGDNLPLDDFPFDESTIDALVAERSAVRPPSAQAIAGRVYGLTRGVTIPGCRRAPVRARAASMRAQLSGGRRAQGQARA
eukprot:5986236-Prymnesium_polylepis.1